MMKIAIILGDITRSRGTERAVCNLATILSNSSKYDVYIISCYSVKASECYYEIPKNIKIINLAFVKKIFVFRIFQYISLYNEIKRVLLKNNISLVLGTTHAFNILLSFLSGSIKKIACEHMNYFACPKYSRLLRRVRYKKLDAVVALTKRDIENYSFMNEEKLYVIPNSLSFTCTELSLLINKKIIAVGGLSSEKGFDELVEMATDLKHKIPDWQINIFGDGELKGMLSDMIERHKVKDFVFLRGTTKNVMEQYKDSSIFVMTSKYECFPMVLLEAQSCGLPIVAFDCNYGPADIIKDGETGFLVALNDKKKYIDKVVTLAENYEMRRKFGELGKENSKKYSEIEIFNMWDELILNITN